MSPKFSSKQPRLRYEIARARKKFQIPGQKIFFTNFQKLCFGNHVTQNFWSKLLKLRIWTARARENFESEPKNFFLHNND